MVDRPLHLFVRQVDPPRAVPGVGRVAELHTGDRRPPYPLAIGDPYLLCQAGLACRSTSSSCPTISAAAATRPRWSGSAGSGGPTSGPQPTKAVSAAGGGLLAALERS